jgi:DNA-directed RNA polymerase specialized sigma subunit
MIHGKGGLPFSSTERFALINLHSEESAKADPHWMEFDDRANGFREIIETIERAVNSLDETHQYLVYETYFNKKPIHYVLDKLNISPATYWRYHKIIMESLDVSFNKGNMVFTMMDVVPLKNDRKVIVNKRKSMIHC